MNRKPIFDAIKDFRGGQGFTAGEVESIDRFLDALQPPALTDWLPQALSLIKQFEGCKLSAYPDPGTGGKPFTIGWGSTTYPDGKPIMPGDVWNQQYADQRLASHVHEFAQGVDKLLAGAKTTANQKAAMVSLAYNIGNGNLSTSTLLKKHKAGDYAGAAQEFLRWNKAAGKIMNGLTRRRAAEAEVYAA